MNLQPSLEKILRYLERRKAIQAHYGKSSVEIRVSTNMARSTVARGLKILQDDGLVKMSRGERGYSVEIRPHMSSRSYRWQWIPVYYLTTAGLKMLKE